MTELAAPGLRDRPDDASHEGGSPPMLAYSELKHRTGVRDGGRFNYHLRELQPEFVASVEDGYRLTDAGLAAARLVTDGPLTDEGDSD